MHFDLLRKYSGRASSAVQHYKLNDLLGKVRGRVTRAKAPSSPSTRSSDRNSKAQRTQLCGACACPASLCVRGTFEY
eukprot:6183073-Pleurochrysis_carterae.AAC.1